LFVSNIKTPEILSCPVKSRQIFNLKLKNLDSDLFPIEDVILVNTSYYCQLKG
jgi:hypothetical protein